MNHFPYTVIHRGAARVAQSAIEREWSAFTGQTMSLYVGRNRDDWIGDPGIDFLIHRNNDASPGLHEALPEWSDGADAAGVFLEAAYALPGLSIRVNTRAFFETTGLARTLRIWNTGDDACPIDRITLDRFNAARTAVRLATPKSPTVDATRDQSGTEPIAVIQDGEGVVIGAERPVTISWVAGDVPHVHLDIHEPVVIPRGGRWQSPATYIIPVLRDFERAFAQDLGAIRLAQRALVKSQSLRRAEL